MTWDVIESSSHINDESVRPRCTSIDVLGVAHNQVDAILNDLFDHRTSSLTPHDQAMLDQLKIYKTLVVLSIGGPAMCGQIIHMIQNASRTPPHQTIIFYDNLSEDHIQFFDDAPHLKDVGVLVISKSGQTLETHMECAHFLHMFERGGCSPRDHFVLATQGAASVEFLPPSALGDMARTHNLPIFRLNPEIDGRFSLFSRVGALMAYLCDVPMDKLAQGGWSAVENARKTYEKTGDLDAYTRPHTTCTDHVLWSYDARLMPLVRWWGQLIGESLGKSGHGITPIIAMGPRDQHSQLH